MSHPGEVSALAALGPAVTVSDTHLRVVRGQRTAEVAIPSKWDKELGGFEHAFPKRARGDQRETVLLATIEDASMREHRAEDRELLIALPTEGVLEAADAGSRRVLSEILEHEYWISAEAKRSYMFPVHSAPALNFVQSGRYKMYRGDILPYLCWDGSQIDDAPIEGLFELLNSNDGLSLLDRLFVDGALRAAGNGAQHEATAADLLGSKPVAGVAAMLADGAYCPEPMTRFREDLTATLQMPLPRHDLVEEAILTLSLHLALYYYEVAFKLGQGVQAAIEAAARRPLRPVDPMQGRIRFRVGLDAGRPVKRDDPCATSWRDLDDRYLIALGANIATANLLHRVWTAADSSGATPRPDPAALAEAMAADPTLADLVDVAAQGFAVLFASRAGQTTTPELMQLARAQHGAFELRATVLKHRRRTLSQTGRKVVNQLARRPFGGSLLRTRGSVRFFELDEEFLALLVCWIIARSGGKDRRVTFAAFIAGLADYGLAPQDTSEERELADALARMGALQRYSDAGEATYVYDPR